MNDIVLTNAKIVGNVGHFNFKFPQTIKFKEYKYLLVIQADTDNFSRLMVYPINNKRVLKLSFAVSEEKMESVKNLAYNFKEFHIIHNSGLILKDQKLLGEIYFDLRFSDSKYKDLKAYLDMNRNVFETIELNEISLQV